MLREIFQEQRRLLDHYFAHLDAPAAEAFLRACLKCQGLLVFTGVGKSGIIAEKIAMTLVSTGTKALYLPPVNFLHGDIGILTENDLLIFLSKSGETEELLNLVPHARRRRTPILSLVSNPRSRLAQASDLFVCLPVEKELCPFGLAPTTSTTAQLLFGDALAVGLMAEKKITAEDFARSHPRGALGKKLTLTVKDLMLKGDQVPFCHPGERLIDVLVELSNKKCGCLLVVDRKKHLLGVFTDGDLRRALQSQGSSALTHPVETLMTVAGLTTTQDTMAWDAMKLMQHDPNRWVMVLPVVEEGCVVGILRMHDIINVGLS
jgi:arabinose-5-phosphate isomerase